jgi:hypothetical protein
MPREDILGPGSTHRGPAREYHSDDTKIDQRPPVERLEDRGGDVVEAERDLKAEYLAELAFMEEPVTIRLEPSALPNAPTTFPVWVNGREGEMLINGQWIGVGWYPVGEVITIKRKYLEVIVRNKIDTISTVHGEPGSTEFIRNEVRRNTSAVHSFSIIEDRNPRGPAWLTELRRRNF